MKSERPEMEFAIEVFVRGHSVGKSRTYPYEASRVGPVWVMRDAERKNPRDYRKEEWIAHGVAAGEVDAIARRHARGRFFVCAMLGEGEEDEPTRSAYKGLGYRLLATEGFFVQRLSRIPKVPPPLPIERVRTPELAARLGKVTRTRPIPDSLLGNDAPFRQYVALDGGEIVGQVRSVDAVGATWCADMLVNPGYRRRGIGPGPARTGDAATLSDRGALARDRLTRCRRRPRRSAGRPGRRTSSATARRSPPEAARPP